VNTPSRNDDNELNALRRTLLALLPGFVLADSASAQDAARTQPQSFRVAFENDKLRALEYRGKPGMGVCGEGLHSHPAHLTIVLFNGKAREKTSDGKVTVGEGKIGDVFWSEAVTHEVENLSGREARSLLIELKPGAGKA
jgi:beta-alanine degradation protein BauB